jgi:O-antigen ligase
MKAKIQVIISSNSTLLLLLPLFVIQFITSEQTINPDFSIRGILFFSYLIVLLIALLFIKKRPVSPLTSPLFIITIVLLLLMISTSLNAINVSVAVKSIVSYSIFPVFLFVFIILIRSFSKSIEHISLLVSFYILILSIISFYQILKVFSLQDFNFIGIYDIRSTLNHKNLFSHILLLSIPFTIFNIYKLSGKIKYFCLFVLFITLLQITIVLTRSTWISLIFTLFLTLIIFFIFRKKIGITINIKSIIIKTFFIFTLVTISSYFIISNYDKSNSFSFQLKSLNNFQSQNIQKRFFLWENTFKMIDDNSIFGAGFGNWKINIPKYAHDDKHNNNGEIRYQTPHNDYLTLFAENGIFGMLLYIFILILGLFYCIKIIRSSKNKDDKFFALLIFGGIIGYIIISMFSAAKEYFETLFFLSIMLSFAIAKNSEINNKAKQSKAFFILTIVFIIISSCGLVYFLNLYNSEKHTKLAVKHMDNNNFELCNDEIHKAYSKYTSCDPTGTPLKWYSGNANFSLRKHNFALKDYREAYRLSPYNSFVLTNIASTYAIKNEYNKAEEFYNKSLEIRPNNKQAINNLIIIYIKQNKISKALNLCLKNNYEVETNRFHTLFILTIKQRVNNALKFVSEKKIKGIIQNRKDDNYWFWLFKTKKDLFFSQNDFNKFVVISAIRQLGHEWKITKKKEKILLNKYRLLFEKV